MTLVRERVVLCNCLARWHTRFDSMGKAPPPLTSNLLLSVSTTCRLLFTVLSEHSMDPEDVALAAHFCRTCFSLARSILRRFHIISNAVLSTTMATEKSSTTMKYVFYPLEPVYIPSVLLLPSSDLHCTRVHMQSFHRRGQSCCGKYPTT